MSFRNELLPKAVHAAGRPCLYRAVNSVLAPNLVTDIGVDPLKLGFSEQIRGIRTVFTSGLFWRIAPWATASQATFLALPWFFLSGGMGMQTRS